MDESRLARFRVRHVQNAHRLAGGGGDAAIALAYGLASPRGAGGRDAAPAGALHALPEQLGARRSDLADVAREDERGLAGLLVVLVSYAAALLAVMGVWLLKEPVLRLLSAWMGGGS